MDGGASALTALSSVFVSTIKIAEKAFEICAVDEQAKAVLQTVNQVSGQLESARILRRQKSTLFTTFEKQMFDETFRRTDEAIKQVAALAERARVDMEVTGGKVRVNTRILFVLRDSPNIHVSLTRLGIASQSLTAAIMTLTCRDPRPIFSSGYDTPPSNQAESRSPPTYEESQFLAEGRQRNMRKRQSAMSLTAMRDLMRDRSYSSLSLQSHQEEHTPELAEYRTGVPAVNVSEHAEEAEDIEFDKLESHFIPPPLRTPRSYNHRSRLSLPTDKELSSRTSSLTASELSAPLPPNPRRDSGIAGLQPKNTNHESYQELNSVQTPTLPGRRTRSAFGLLQPGQHSNGPERPPPNMVPPPVQQRWTSPSRAEHQSRELFLPNNSPRSDSSHWRSNHQRSGGAGIGLGVQRNSAVVDRYQQPETFNPFFQPPAFRRGRRRSEQWLEARCQ